MRTYIRCIFPVLTGICVACTSPSKYEGVESFGWDAFQKPTSLQADTLKFDDELMKPIRILVLDSLLLTKNVNTQHFFHVYNLNNMKKVGECISFGAGPQEMIDPIWMPMSNGDFGVLDRNKKVLDVYQGRNILINDSIKPIKHITFNEMLMNAVCLPGVGIISSTMTSAENKFIAINLDGQLISYFGDYPKEYKSDNPMQNYSNFMGELAVKPDGTRWMIAHKLTDMLEIYDNKLNLLKRIQGPDGILPQAKVTGEGISHGKDVKTGYFFPVATDKYIYVLYAGGKYDGQSQKRYLHDKLLVFNWKGKPVKYYQLSDPVLHFTVDEKRNMLYGLSDSPEVHIVAYSL